jgi:hypothetical protein
VLLHVCEFQHTCTHVYIQISCYWMSLISVTIVTSLISVKAWPSSLILASVIDNAWGVCCCQCTKVGKQLMFSCPGNRDRDQSRSLASVSVHESLIIFSV